MWNFFILVLAMGDFTHLCIFLLITSIIQGGQGQVVEMDSEISGYVGSKVELGCLFVNADPPVKISQVTWQKMVNGTKVTVAIANPLLGISVAPPFRDRVAFKYASLWRRGERGQALDDATITMATLRLLDEGLYVCEYATFPAGNREGTVNLTVNARPTTQMSLATPTLVARSSNQKTPVATCISANGKPPGSIRWETQVPGEATTKEVRNSDGTFTVKSEYILVPNRDTHQESLTCITTYNEEVFTDSVTLNIQYEPEVLIEGFDGNWYLNRENVQLSCQANANPAVSLYQWRRVNGSIPTTIEVQDNVLYFKGPVTYAFEGLYVCDATNSIGMQSASVEVLVTDKPLPLLATGDVISVIGLLFAAGVLLGITITVLVLKVRWKHNNSDSPSRKLARPIRKDNDVQYSGKLYEELPNTADYASYRLACNKNDDYPEFSPPISFVTPATNLPGPVHPPEYSQNIFRYPTVTGGLSPPSPPTLGVSTFPKEQYV